MVALFNGVGGGAVALISFVGVPRPARDSGGNPELEHADPDPVRGDHRLGLLLGLEHRLRQAAGADPRPADPAARPAVHQHRRCSLVAVGCVGGDRRRHRVARACSCVILLAAARAREHVRAADRRRRHAGRDLAAERLHRPVGGGRRHRARQRRADRRRHARGRLGLDPHQPDGRGDEPLDREHLRRRLRRRHRRGRRRRRRRAAAGPLHRRRRTWRSSSPTPRRSWSRPATAWRSRRPSTRCASWPTSWRSAASASTTRSTPSPAACPAT